MLDAASKLNMVKMAHTVIWAVLAGCVLAIPFLAASGNIRAATWLIAIIMLEVVVLAFNRMRCPLTDVAGKFTTDRTANFDIYLPEWLATHNKVIFGSLYVIGIGVTAYYWK